MSHIIADLPNYMPTKAQRRWLLDLLAGKVPAALCGGVQWGGGTEAGLLRRGLIDQWIQLTDLGRKLAQALKDQNEPGDIQREYFRESTVPCPGERHEPEQPIGGVLPAPVPSPRLDHQHVPAPQRVQSENVLGSASSRAVSDPAEGVDIARRGDVRSKRGRTKEQFVTIAAQSRENKRRRIAALKEKIKARLAATMDIAERQSLRHELELADLRMELIAAKEDPGDL